MPYYIIERSFAEQINPPVEGAALINEINDEEDVRWVFSYLSLDRRKTYCLYEALLVEAVRVAAERVGLFVDLIVEVSGRVMPSGTLESVQ